MVTPTARMLRVGHAAQRLGLSRRQFERLVQRYKDEGPAGLVSRKRGRPSNRQLTGAGHRRARNDLDQGALRGLWADAGLREAARMPWPVVGQGDR